MENLYFDTLTQRFYIPVVFSGSCFSDQSMDFSPDLVGFVLEQSFHSWMPFLGPTLIVASNNMQKYMVD